MGKTRTTKAKRANSASGIHVVTAGSKVCYNTGGHDTRKRTAEYARSAKALKAITKTLGKSWYFAHADEAYQDHHGGGLWALDDEGWFFVRNLVGIEWSGQFCADPAKVDVLRQNARRFYSGFPKTFAAMKKFGIDLQDLLDSEITTPDHVERWTDSICNASVPLPQRFHTGAVPKGGGVHNYPTPVTDIDRFRFDDFRLWVTDEEGKAVAVVPTNKRGGKDPTRNVKIIEATPGTKLYAKHERAQKAGKTLIADEGHPLAKQAFRKAKRVVYPDSGGSR
jgi:hypothetical protein